MDGLRSSFRNILSRSSGVRLLAIAVPAILILAAILFRSQLGGFFGPYVPPPPCGTAAIQLGTTTFRMQNLAAAAAVPSGKPSVAYWIADGTHISSCLSTRTDVLSLLATAPAYVARRVCLLT